MWDNFRDTFKLIDDLMPIWGLVSVLQCDTSRNQVSTSNYGYHLPLKVRAVIDFQIENEKALGIIG